MTWHYYVDSIVEPTTLCRLDTDERSDVFFTYPPPETQRWHIGSDAWQPSDTVITDLFHGELERLPDAAVAAAQATIRATYGLT